MKKENKIDKKNFVVLEETKKALQQARSSEFTEEEEDVAQNFIENETNRKNNKD